MGDDTTVIAYVGWQRDGVGPTLVRIDGVTMQTVVRTLTVLRELAQRPQGLTLQQLSDALDIPASSLHRLLAVLSEEGFAGRASSSKRYFLGPAARALGASGRDVGSLLNTPHQAVVDAAHESGETLFVTEFIGGQAVCVALVEGRRPLRLFVRIGQEMPLHAAASARTVIAERPEDELLHLLTTRDLPAYTPTTPTSAPEVLAHLATVRERGYDICADELDDNVWAVAAPVRRAGGEVFASLTLAAPAERYRDPSARDDARDLVLGAAARIAADMGFLPEE